MENVRKHMHPRLFEEYNIDSTLETKNMSIWAKGTHLKTQTPRTIEILNLDSRICQADRFYCVEAFLRKSMTLRQIQNRHCLQVLDAGFSLHDLKAFIVFPYYPSLRTIIEAKTKQINLRSLVRDVKAALLHARDEYGICHGNLRPEVIYYHDAEDRYIVSDFSIPYKILDKNENKSDTLFEHLKEFQKVHPPFELAQMTEVDEQGLNIGPIDVFSLGIVLLECIGISQERIAGLKNFDKVDNYEIYLDGLRTRAQKLFKDEGIIKMLHSLLDPNPNMRIRLEDIQIESQLQESSLIQSKFIQSERLAGVTNESIPIASEISMRAEKNNFMATSTQCKQTNPEFQNEKWQEKVRGALDDIPMITSEIFSPKKPDVKENHLNTKSFLDSRIEQISMTESVIEKPKGGPREDSYLKTVDNNQLLESRHGISRYYKKASDTEFGIISENSNEKYLKKTDFSRKKTSIFIGWGSKRDSQEFRYLSLTNKIGVVHTLYSVPQSPLIAIKGRNNVNFVNTTSVDIVGKIGSHRYGSPKCALTQPK